MKKSKSNTSWLKRRLNDVLEMLLDIVLEFFAW